MIQGTGPGSVSDRGFLLKPRFETLSGPARCDMHDARDIRVLAEKHLFAIFSAETASCGSFGAQFCGFLQKPRYDTVPRRVHRLTC